MENKMKEKLTINEIVNKKKTNIKITNTTAYDFVMATIVDDAGIDMIGVGGSLGMIILGYQSIVPVTMNDMIHHLVPVVKAVKRGVIIAPLPFGSYQESNEQAVKSAITMLKAGADSVQMQGGGTTIDRTKAIVDANIPCIGHTGLTPQYVAKIGGLRAVGKTAKEAKKVYDDCLALEDAGAWAIELECVPDKLGKKISEKVLIPVISVGSGPYCDGQYLNLYDALGLLKDFKPRFSKQYASFYNDGVAAMKQFKKEVRDKKFPEEKHLIKIANEEWEKFEKYIDEYNDNS